MRRNGLWRWTALHGALRLCGRYDDDARHRYGPDDHAPAVSTGCCQAVGACFDADAADAQATCAALPAASHATLAPAGEICDGVAGTCGAMKKVGRYCCQCPVNGAHGFPHPQYCFDTNITSCGPGLCQQNPGACGPSSQTCGGP